MKQLNKRYQRVNLELTKKDWCGYNNGECYEYMNISKNCLCFHCVYKKQINIPCRLKGMVKNVNGNE